MPSYRDADEDYSGLGAGSRDDWPETPPEGTLPIDLMDPKGKIHRVVRDYLCQRIRESERYMTQFYARWGVAEKKLQAYIDLPHYEQILKDMNDSGKPASPVEITVPYSYATIMTIVSYVVQVLCAERPMFPIGSYSGNYVQAAQNMETVLQYQADHTRMLKKIIQYVLDGENYGLQVMRLTWSKIEAMRTVLRMPSTPMLVIPGMSMEPQRVREMRTVYEGNDVMNVDPYLFFPDPRVPMSEVARKGEFVFWRQYEGKHLIKALAAAGTFKWCEFAGTMPRASGDEGQSQRNLMSLGQSIPGYDVRENEKQAYQVDQGTIDLIPAELGLGESESPEKWLFTMLNKQQIVQAEPFTADHGLHPVAVGEPYTLGYGFGQPSMSDFLGPLQDTISWFVNSHMMNVRTALNNIFVVDPSRIELQDFKNPAPGKILRLKRAAIGQDVRTIVQQLQVQDVTRGHINDLQQFTQFGDILSAVGDNVRGQQDQGGRRSATESRQAFMAAGARLAHHTRLISSQGIQDCVDMMVLNSLQYLDPTFYRMITGKGMEDSIWAGQETQVGDFHYQTSDGTMPMDRVAMLDVWKEIFLALLQTPLGQFYNLPEIFKFIAELGGAKNITEFEIKPQADAQLQAAAQAGNVVPIGGGPNPNVQAAPQAPAARAAGGY